MGIKNILVVLVDRANYGRMKPVMNSLNEDDYLELGVMCSGTMMLPRFGEVVNIVEDDGFNVVSKIYLEIEGSNPVTMSKSIGLGIIEYTSEFNRLSPDLILLIGDRYEALGATISASYLNIPVAHIQGGEVSGSIDESCRHAITKFSHLHFPNTDRSRDYIIRMGEDPAIVHNVGCPSGDYIHSLPDDLKPKDLEEGLGNPINLKKPFLLVIFHPVTTRGGMRGDVEQLLEALDKINMQTIWLWPNIDAGADRISTAIRSFRERNKAEWLYLAKNFKPETYQKILKKTACAIGNSSSFIRDSSFSGTPVVLVGDRQVGRERDINVVESELESKKIYTNINNQLDNGKYRNGTLYGHGNASIEIKKVIKSFQPKIQKTIHYIYEDKI
tara:strand:- start:1037 stop:2197 length:1161 start_codon:yes stop_codon:yes gene_type:complete